MRRGARSLGAASSAKQHNNTPWDLLVVGLGNPGPKYRGTLHNVGVEVLDLLAERHREKFRSSKEHALVAELRIGAARVALAFPQTYMNESGRSVGPLVKRYGIDDLTKLVVVHDELDLDPGRLGDGERRARPTQGAEQRRFLAQQPGQRAQRCHGRDSGFGHVGHRWL